jgi:hypothetical protein
METTPIQPTTLRDTPSKGIPDFDQKLGVLMSVLGKRTQWELADELLKRGSYELKLVTSPDTLVQSFKSWRPGPNAHDPTGDAGRTFLDCATCVLNEMGCTESSLRTIIHIGSVDDLIDLLPETLVTPEIESLRKRDAREEGMLVVRLATETRPPSVKEDYERGVMDQRLCYLAPDAAAVWDAVAKAGTYRQYQQCSEALEAFLALPKWQEFCREQAPDGAIALGAGSASKDLMIIESLQSLVPESRPKLAYRLVDYSIYMLTGTEAAIQTGLRDVGSWRPIEVVTLCKDFTDLKPWRHLRRPGVPAAWFINGGTIGNINEADFLNSIAKRAEVGDWLMISMDTIPEDAATPGGRERFTAELKDKYDQPYLRELLRPSLAAVWPYLDYPRSFEKALLEIEVDIVSGTQRRHSAIPNSLSVEFSTAGGNKNVVLLASTRYVEQSFVDYAATDGFKKIDSIPSRKNPCYKLVAFKYEG